MPAKAGIQAILAEQRTLQTDPPPNSRNGLTVGVSI